MQSKALTVDDYLAEAPADRREALERIRALAREHLPQHVEVMQYGMIGYQRDGAPEVSVASQKQYLALYIGGGVYERHPERMQGHDYGKSCLRFRRMDRVDYALIADLLADRAAQPPGA
jgi:uncharacterized protein YdhG (YjbR/CyaY superfamily)